MLHRVAGKLSVTSATFQTLRHSRKLYPARGITFLHMNKTYFNKFLVRLHGEYNILVKLCENKAKKENEWLS